MYFRNEEGRAGEGEARRREAGEEGETGKRREREKSCQREKEKKAGRESNAPQLYFLATSHNSFRKSTMNAPLQNSLFFLSSHLSFSS
jgi:hypothetical protein